MTSSKRVETKTVVLTKEDLARILKEYEAKYHMATPEFATKYNRGELPEDIEYMKWISYYDWAFDAGLYRDLVAEE